MRKFVLSLSICLQFLTSCGQDGDTTRARFTATEKKFSYHLGDSVIKLVALQYGKRSDIVMLNLHDDEITSVEAAKLVLEETGGVLIKIDNYNKRLLEFTSNGKLYRFDPNRMFSLAGIRASLGKHSQVNKAATEAIRGFARFVLNKIPPPSPTLIALHNNDADRLTIASYMPGNDYGPDVSQVVSIPGADPDNFLFTTDTRIFRHLKDSFNIASQHNKKAVDDGSLSIYYGRRKKSYVNVEAEHGQLDEQVRMIRAVVGYIRK